LLWLSMASLKALLAGLSYVMTGLPVPIFRENP